MFAALRDYQLNHQLISDDKSPHRIASFDLNERLRACWRCGGAQNNRCGGVLQRAPAEQPMRGRAAAHHVRCGASVAHRHSRRATRHMARRNCTFEPSLCCTPLMARAPLTTRCVCQCRCRASPLDTTSRRLCARIAECAPRIAREMARAATHR